MTRTLCKQRGVPDDGENLACPAAWCELTWDYAVSILIRGDVGL
jgi:hypothetical protein